MTKFLYSEIILTNQILNELFEALDGASDTYFNSAIGNKVETKRLFLKIKTFLDIHNNNTILNVEPRKLNIDFKELNLVFNAGLEVLKYLDYFEFEMRVGFNIQEYLDFIKKIYIILDEEYNNND